jgi:hypothetical protein
LVWAEAASAARPNGSQTSFTEYLTETRFTLLKDASLDDMAGKQTGHL